MEQAASVCSLICELQKTKLFSELKKIQDLRLLAELRLQLWSTSMPIIAVEQYCPYPISNSKRFGQSNHLPICLPMNLTHYWAYASFISR